jgi:hypothetical protein
MAVVQLEEAESLLGYSLLYLILLLYLTRSYPKLFHSYSLLATADVRPLAPYNMLVLTSPHMFRIQFKRTIARSVRWIFSSDLHRI